MIELAIYEPNKSSNKRIFLKQKLLCGIAMMQQNDDLFINQSIKKIVISNIVGGGGGGWIMMGK
ncbi:hypothetical protein DERP_001980 [Dermatophagoides pteronyssinus]|uniref:Uncharacterized protein n=1 Tax=Dermatophagoides pteronyssinus TaxID=6956 RepID=A0ABQ8JBZ8_DERPT|nr:hypothetical protein DERP_001980 [Dermatophagoides pteronyssinus]